MDSMKIRFLLLCVLISITITISSTETTKEDSSHEEELISANYVLPKQIFNDGKPFYLDKDPISGQLDFSSKKPAGIEPEVNEVVDPKEKATVLSSVSPNFHDFLNLPVKYSSSKFVYPLVSSSYANLKYQGNNKNYVSNHKNYSTTTTTSTPKYYTLHKVSATKAKPTPTKTTIISSTWRPALQNGQDKTTMKPKVTPPKKIVFTERTTVKAGNDVTTQKPTKISATSAPSKMTTILKTSTTSLKISTTNLPAKTTVGTTRKPTLTPTPTTRPTPTQTTTKVIPSRASTTEATSTTKFNRTTTPVKTTKPPKTTVTPKITPKTTLAPTPSVNKRPLMKNATATQVTRTTPLPTLGAADVYNRVSNKTESNSISLADLFNALAEEEDHVYKPSNSGLDSNGNLMQPFSPARPAPFTLQKFNKLYTSTQPPTTTVTTMKTTPSTTTTERMLYDVPEENTNDYVRYEVQQPNMMQLQYHPAPSMNNIVISPGQNSASFVLGSQQAIGSNQYVASVEKEPLFQNGERIQYGTVINEDLVSAMEPQIPVPNPVPNNDRYPQISETQNRPMEPPQTQDFSVPATNFRFPNDVVNYGGVPEIVNGHAQPVALPNVQQNSVAFPQTENSWLLDSNVEETARVPSVVFKDDDNYEIKGPQKQEILTLNQHNLHNQVSFPQLPEDLTPPQLPEEQPRPHITSPPGHLYSEFTRKPLPGLHRPNLDRPLPNILPQFRPNAKISPGHYGHNKESGNVRITHQKLPYPNRSMPPPFSHRRTPITNRYSPKYSAEPVEANRRVYRVPPPQIDRVYMHRNPQALNRPPYPLRYVENYQMERHPSNSDAFTLKHSEVKPERLPAFEEEDLMVEDPPKPMVDKEPESPKYEPVVTLQMLKSHKKSPSDAASSNNPITQPDKTSGQSPVYVVYPVKSSPLHMDMLDSSDKDDPIVIGQRGEQPPQPPIDRDFSADYQNTPFSVVRDQPQEPILMAKNKSQSNKVNFPYPLEKPDPTFAEFNDQKDADRFNRETDIQISPRVVNRGNSISREDSYRTTEVPIAIAYTPTERNKYYANYPAHDKFSHPNLANQVIPEIRDTQTEAVITEDVDTRGQFFEKDFMAPFYPSMSLNAVTNSPNGWSVYPGTTDGSVYEKNNINRADVENTSREIENSTKKFDPDKFQPELQGGFKPIYPPGYKTRDQSNDEEESSPKPVFNVETSSTSTITTSTTERSIERQKSKLEASIESLLFGDDDDFEDDEQTEETYSNTSS